MPSSVTLVFLQLWGSLAISLAQKVCPRAPVLPHASIADGYEKPQYQQGDVIYYACETGYTSGPSIKYACTSEGWHALRKGKCALKQCQLPDEIPNGRYEFTVGEDFVFGSVIQYHCDEGYQMMSKSTTRTCMLDGWSNRAPECEPLSCAPPNVADGVTVTGLPNNDEAILPGQFLSFSCDVEGKRLNGSSRLVCGSDGQWDHPFPSCEDIACKVDASILHRIPNGLLEANNTFKVGHTLNFSCNQGFIYGSQKITCLESGEWDHPFPTCSDSPRRQNCPRPPAVADGDIEGSLKSSYSPNERVRYVCPAFYIMENNQHVKTCTNGQWVGSIRCLRPCTVNRDDMNAHNIKFKYKRDDKLYSTHKDFISFICVDGKSHDGRLDLRQQCLDGVMHLPTCV